MYKDSFEVGERVWFTRLHDTVTKLLGRIVKKHDGPADLVDVATEVDGKKVEASTLETAHAASLVLAPDQKQLPASSSAPASAVLPAAQQAGTRVIARG
jgi:hypothetical protein